MNLLFLLAAILLFILAVTALVGAPWMIPVGLACFAAAFLPFGNILTK